MKGHKCPCGTLAPDGVVPSDVWAGRRSIDVRIVLLADLSYW